MVNVFGVRMDLRCHRLLGISFIARDFLFLGISFFIPSAPNPPKARGWWGFGEEGAFQWNSGTIEQASRTAVEPSSLLLGISFFIPSAPFPPKARGRWGFGGR